MLFTCSWDWTCNLLLISQKHFSTQSLYPLHFVSRWIWAWSLSGSNSQFSFSWTCCHVKIKEHSLPIAKGERIRYIHSQGEMKRKQPYLWFDPSKYIYIMCVWVCVYVRLPTLPHKQDSRQDEYLSVAYIYIYIYIYIYHHHVVPPPRISLTLSRHSSLSFIASGRSLGLHPLS